jgi:hypothetical protein
MLASLTKGILAYILYSTVFLLLARLVNVTPNSSEAMMTSVKYVSQKFPHRNKIIRHRDIQLLNPNLLQIAFMYAKYYFVIKMVKTTNTDIRILLKSSTSITFFAIFRPVLI